MTTCCENMASHHEQIMEKTQKFQIVLQALQTFVNISQLTSQEA